MDRTFWHYTNAAGLYGILSSESIWATDIAFLNDTKELKYGFSVLSEALQFYLATLNNHPEITSDERKYLSDTAWILGGLDPSEIVGRTYVCSFSWNGDELTQWRGYGKGGYSLGINPEKLTEALLGTPLHINSYTVSYGDDAVKSANISASRSIERFRERGLDPLNAMQVEVRFLANILAPRLKHGAFKSEAEQRFFVSGEACPSFRVSGDALIPYVAIPLPLDCVTEIVVGPGPDQSLRVEGLELFIKSLNFSDPPIVAASSIPFRG